MERFIKINKELVLVSEEVYQVFYKSKRKDRYFENDIKVGSIKIDIEKEKITLIPSKEDSVERLLKLKVGNAKDAKDEKVIFLKGISKGKSVEDIVADYATLDILTRAKAELTREERSLIDDIYYGYQTTRQIAVKEGISQPAVVKRHKKVLEKLKKYLDEFGY